MSRVSLPGGAAQLSAEKVRAGTVVSVILNLFTVLDPAFFGVYLGFSRQCAGIMMNILRYRKKLVARKSLKTPSAWGRTIYILTGLGGIVCMPPVLSFVLLAAPSSAWSGCLIPAWLVYKANRPA